MEDSGYGELRFAGQAPVSLFRKALERGLAKSVRDGFGVQLPGCGKYIPPGRAIPRSIISLRVDKSTLSLSIDRYGKLRAQFTDGAGTEFSGMPVTDLGLLNRLEAEGNVRGALRTITAHVARQSEVFLRLGLTRRYPVSDGRDGYWIQINGIYTFPDPYGEMRTYESSP